jgi:hypothetical protein
MAKNTLNDDGLVDRTYVLIGKAPLSYYLHSKDSKRKALKYFDEKLKINRALRYSSNQRSPFIDEQDDQAVVEPIIFEDGQLFVTRENQVLQKFLHYHPMNGVKFKEQDNAKDAQEELDWFDVEEKAIDLAKDLDIEMAETLCRVALNLDVSKMTTQEIRKDVKKYARRFPQGFMDAANDPKLQLYGHIAGMIDERILIIRNKDRDVYYNLKDNKSLMLVVPFGADPIGIISDYLQTDEGLPALNMLRKALGVGGGSHTDPHKKTVQAVSAPADEEE